MKNQESIQEALSAYLPIKWRVQSSNNKAANCVCYIDARDAMERLDKVFGVGGWQRDQKEVKGVVYGGVGVLIDGQWVWKWDAGTESNTEKQKGEASDAFKRVCVNLGIGRFMYDLPIIKLGVKEYNKKFRPTNNKGEILWSGDDLTSYINSNLPFLSKMSQEDLNLIMNKPEGLEAERSAIVQVINAGLLQCKEPEDFALLKDMINAAPKKVAVRLADTFRQQMKLFKVSYNAQTKEYFKSAA